MGILKLFNFEFWECMILNNEQLKQKAHELALSHDAYISRTRPKPLSRIVQFDIDNLQAFVQQLRERRSVCCQAAEEWLIDHAPFIEEQALSLQEELETGFVGRLPYLKRSGETRIYSLCEQFLLCTDGHLADTSLIMFIQAYQEIAVLTLAEAWLIPLALRLALMRKLSQTCDTLRERRESCLLVERLLAESSGPFTAEAVKHTLEHGGLSIPLSGAMIAHIVQHLRERSDEMEAVRESLLCMLENGPESLERIVYYENELQAGYQVTTGNLISSLRTLERWDWSAMFEQISVVEHTLEQERSGDYRRMDELSRDTVRRAVERLARRLHVPENLVAAHAVELAGNIFDDCERAETAVPRSAFPAYYVLEPRGIRQLRQALRACSKPRAVPEAGLWSRANAVYFYSLAVVFVAAAAVFLLWTSAGERLTAAQWVIAALFAALPASEWAVTLTHMLVERTRRPVRLLRYDFSSGVPEEAATLVVIPVIWSEESEVRDITDRLEQHYLANRGACLHFAILSDFCDAADERQPGDDALVKAAMAGIRALRRQYPDGSFHVLQRSRQWNASENAWMGWERKRGKLVELVELLRGRTDTSYEWLSDGWERLRAARYMITLDADTRLPLESAARMIGALHLPYNRPRLNERGTRVVEGYGVLQPRIGITHEAAMRSRLAYLFAADPGCDPYAFAVSDPYQDGLGEGLFTGKGIFDIDVFHQVLCDRIPNNRVLSHDLLEGGFLRTGYMSDLELIDDHPAKLVAWQKRLHRWVRGDWQLLPWLFRRCRNRRGELVPVDLSLLTRWQMLDNLRRSLLLPGLLTLSLLALLVLPGAPQRWLALAAATLLLPVVRQLVSVRSLLRDPRSLLPPLGHAALTLATAPYQAVIQLDAIGKTLYRLLFSKRRLLEWVSSAEVERTSGRSADMPMLGLYGGLIALGLFALAALRQTYVPVQIALAALCVLWLIAPLAVRVLERPVGAARADRSFGERGERQLRELSQQIWMFFEDYVTREDNWLPPDNVQLDPPNGVARRTSPTNIGLYMTCVVAARDFGWIDTRGMLERLERTTATIERLDKWEGHLYNWYDTATLRPLPPLYVSTVDSGNFAACLIAVKEGVKEWLEAGCSADVASDGRRLAQRLERLVEATDFRPLYNHDARLLVLGYHVSDGRRDQILYDLLASEARQASFVAIALGQISQAHWQALGRTMAQAGAQPVMLSWSGTMFEYLMPWLLMKSYKNTVWEHTYRTVVDRQIRYAEQRGVPFGISESGYYGFDYQMNYQYKAFGVPELGFKRGMEQELVVAPYAAIMALPFAPDASLRALQQLDRLGARGKYGYYEAVDFTAARMPQGEHHRIVYSFMAHHQGMSLLALANALLPHKMYDRFHRDPQVRSAELLLQERMPKRPRLIRHSAVKAVLAAQTEEKPHMAQKEFSGKRTALPETHMLSNGMFTTLLTADGTGFCAYDGLMLSRWREDPLLDPWGYAVYVRDVANDRCLSPSYYPCGADADGRRSVFAPDKVVYSAASGDLHTGMEVCVSTERHADVRKLTVKNKGAEPVVVEVTTCIELALADAIADAAHPAFSKLFVRTEYEAAFDGLLAVRRPRQSSDRMIWAAHALTVDGGQPGAAEFETDRSAFIGRGRTAVQPAGLRARLRGTVGSVADPAFVLRRRVRLKPGEQATLHAIFAAADTREEAIDIIRQLESSSAVERAFQLAWNRAQIDLAHFRLTAAEALDMQTLAARALYTPPFRDDRRLGIAANTLGQSALWAYGISGDRPIVAVRIADRRHLPFVGKLLAGYDYLRWLGAAFDVVVLNEAADGYHQHMQEELQRLTAFRSVRPEGGHSGVHVLAADLMSDAERTLVMATARVMLRADGPGLAAQLRRPSGGTAPTRPEAARAAAVADSKRAIGAERGDSAAAAYRADSETSGDAASEDTDTWQMFNGYGGFSPDGSEYRILHRPGHDLPAPWINVLANKQFGAVVSELGTGYTWWKNSRECKLTPWSNDPAFDPLTEAAYMCDDESGDTWLLTPSALQDSRFRITHGLGYSAFHHERAGIRHSMLMFVPLEQPVKIMRVQLVNIGSSARSLSLTYYAEWVLGVSRESTAPYIVTEWLDDSKLLIARNTYQETFRDATAFVGVYDTADSDTRGSVSWTADRGEFIGRSGSRSRPEGLARKALSGETGALHDPCGAVQRKLTLAPGETRTFVILLGCASSADEASALARDFSSIRRVNRELQETTEHWRRLTGQMRAATPSREMDVLLNGWLLYQTVACRMWARSAFYQAGGAFGFRDQLQDALALLHADPDATREQIMLHAAHQYEEGDVQHWWHVETGRGIRTKFSDDLLWLPYAISRYIEHTGDETLLALTAPYLRSEPLSADEHERYEAIALSGNEGTMFEHGCRAIDLALSKMGEHGLPLIGVGDWNDGMNLVGAEGRGESVWLGWFLCDVLERFAVLCERQDNAAKAAHYRGARSALAAALLEHGWDGQWFRRAFTDSGQWLGSVHNEECTIDAIAQSWSVISGAAPLELAERAMRAFDRELVDRELDVIRLLTPPFDRTEPSPGYIQGYPPGIRENGAQYTHGVIWSVVAWGKLGNGDKAFELFNMLNPLNHTRTEHEVRQYMGEPYAMAADVYTADPHRGRAGWTWYTGAAGWMYQAGMEWILGVRRRGSRLYVEPCIPAKWTEYSVMYTFGSTVYDIHVRNPHGKSSGVAAVSVDGASSGELYVHLNDDGESHHVEVTM